MSKQASLLHTKTDSIANKDSLLAETSSIFSGHTLKPIHTTPIFNASSTSYWPGILLFLIFSIYVLIRISEPKKILKIFISVFSLQEAKQLFREEFKLTKRASLFLAIGFVLVVAFLIQITNQYFGIILTEQSHLKQYVFFVGVICATYLIKFLANYLLAFISSNNDLGKEYLFNVFVYSQTIGIILFPLIVCLQFTKYPAELFLYPALVICAGFYVLRMFRGFIISVTEQNVGILYIFLYLCALEILPLLVLIKFLLVNF
ncbi:MAG: DUF4271 domain-containing protein [Bacteroidia bacterium]|nr:DUF4271 domain-containing protein [Bacteroidia bacterium]